jgi:16S rRNA G966 N2-methylase RsmD
MNGGDHINLKDFILNEEGSFSITRPYESSQIIFLICNFIKFHHKNYNISNKILTDGTACMGGDLIRFSRYFKIINGVEIEEDNFDHLVKNCKKFNCENVNLFFQDYLQIFDKLKQDIIYLDPRWGGVKYKTKENIVLKIGDLELSTLIQMIKEKKLCDFIFIKAPSNTYLDNLEYDAIYTIFNKSKVPSFKLICIRL